MLYRYVGFLAGPTPNPSPKWEGGMPYTIFKIPVGDAQINQPENILQGRIWPPSHLGEGLGVGPTRSATPRSARKIFISLALLLLTLSLSAQDTRGVQPINQKPSNQKPSNQTRAVVVGISNYQSPAIPDLKYADRDAEAFAEWLRSPAGGSVPEENIRLLTNEKAKNAQIVADLDGLAENAQEGDLVIIYFSGHGDVETKTFNQLGFLLAWDSAPNNYKAMAYSLGYLQDVISTISLLKKARVVVVTDACHAGKLAGSTFGGTQLASTNLAKQFANEVKIMSCQPNELALEGEQWGGGRGVFSYNLIEGLTGLADKNADTMVNLYEIDRYLGDVVPAQTAPHSQIPMVVGDKQFLLSRVDVSSLADWNDRKAGKPSGMAATSGKGFAEGLLADSDSALLQLYHAFETALEKGNLLDGSPSADELYTRLSKEEKLRPIHGLMRRNLAAALQNEPQQALNALLADDPYEVNNLLYSPSKYTDYPRYLRRTIELLGEKHYMYPTLRAKELYFEGYLIAQLVTKENATNAFRDSVRLLAKVKILEAIALDPQAAYLYYSIGKLYWYNSPPRTDSLMVWCNQAIQRAPQWLMPYLEVAYEYNVTCNEPEKSEPWLKKAIAINPNSYNVQERLSWLYQWMNRTDESLALSEKMISERPDLFNAHSTAGVTCLLRKEFDRAERYFEKAITLEPGTSNFAKQFTIFLLAKTRRQRAAFALSDFIFNSPMYISERENSLDYLRTSLLANRQYEAAAQVAERELKMNLIDTHRSESEATLGIAQIMKGNHREGRTWIQKAYKTAPTFEASLLRLRQYEAIIAEKEGRPARADSLFRAAFGYRLYSLSLDNRLADYTAMLREDYARFLLRQNRDAEATEQIKKLLEEEPNSWRGYYCMAVLHAGKGYEHLAVDWLEKALDRWLPTPELLTEEAAFKKISKTKRFKTLLAKHFPDTTKQ